MRMGMRRVLAFAGMLALVAAFSAAAEAQVPTVDLENEDFPTNQLPGGWTATGMWAVDNTPMLISGHTPPYSLNYNDGLDYDNGSTNSGIATSPTYDISTLTSPMLEFWSWFATEAPTGMNRANNHDTRIVRIYSAGSPPTVRYEAQLVDVMAIGDGQPVLPTTITGTQMTWQRVGPIALDPAWGQIYVTFEFDTVDDLYNNDAGWAIDDFRIYYTDTSGGGGGGGGGSYTGPGYFNQDGVWVGFADGNEGPTPPLAPPGTGTPLEPGSYNADGVYVGVPGSTDVRTGESANGDDSPNDSTCGLMGLELLLPLGLLRLARRRR